MPLHSLNGTGSLFCTTRRDWVVLFYSELSMKCPCLDARVRALAVFWDHIRNSMSQQYTESSQKLNPKSCLKSFIHWLFRTNFLGGSVGFYLTLSPGQSDPLTGSGICGTFSSSELTREVLEQKNRGNWKVTLFRQRQQTVGSRRGIPRNRISTATPDVEGSYSNTSHRVGGRLGRPPLRPLPVSAASTSLGHCDHP